MANLSLSDAQLLKLLKKETNSEVANDFNVAKETGDETTILSSQVQLERMKSDIQKSIENMPSSQFERIKSIPIEQFSEIAVKHLMIRGINELRKKEKKSELKHNARLETLAQDFLTEINDEPRNYQDVSSNHFSKKSGGFLERMNRAGLFSEAEYKTVKQKNSPRSVYRGIGENVVLLTPQTTMSSLLNGLQESKGHYDATMYSGLNSIGIGYFSGAKKMVHIFVKFKNN